MLDVATGSAAEAPPLEFSLSAIILGVSRLRAEASALVSRWNDLDEGARLAALNEIARRAEQLDARWRWAPGGDSLAPVSRLTRRELEVLPTRINVSVSTIRSHIKSILAKLGVHSRAEALALALRHGLIPLQ